MADQVTACNCLALFTLAENWSFRLDEFSCCKDVLLGKFSKKNIIMTKNVDKKRDYSDSKQGWKPPVAYNEHRASL